MRLCIDGRGVNDGRSEGLSVGEGNRLCAGAGLGVGDRDCSSPSLDDSNGDVMSFSSSASGRWSGLSFLDMI